MRIVGVHGFRVDDGGLRTLEPTLSELRRYGYRTRRIDYGHVHLLRVRLKMQDAVDLLVAKEPDIIFAHSNGCAVAHRAIEQGLKVQAVVAYQPAMRSDETWPERAGNVLVMYNPDDYAVLLGKWWRYINPFSWFVRHHWGEAGRTGFVDPAPHVAQVDVSEYGHTGHSYLSSFKAARFWAPRIDSFLTGA